VRTRLLVIALAGTAAAAVAALPGNTASAGVFGTPVVVSGVNASEPGIDVAPDGTLYVNAPPGIGSQLPFSPSYVWRSGDAGATWVQTPFSLRGDMPGGGDSDVSVAPDGTLSWTDLWLGSSTVGRSTDKAQSWTAQPAVGEFVQDRQWVAGVGGGVVYHVTHQVPSGITVARSVDGGVTYATRTIAAHVLDQTGCLCPSGTMVAQAGTPLVAGQQATSISDKVGVIYYTSTGGVKFARSTNSGTTWAQSTVKAASGADTGKAFPVVARDGNTLTAVWQEVSGSTSTVGFSFSLDWGVTWSAPQTIVSGGSSTFPWVDVRGGKIGVSVFHTTTAGTPDSVGGSAQWFESYTEATVPASVTTAAAFSALQTADPTAAKTGPVCTAGINCGGDRELGDFQAIVLDASLRPNLTYVRVINAGTGDTEVRFVRQ
jgi:hypothetical protein